MSRIVSIWLRAWPIARFLRAQASGAPANPVDPMRPFVLVAPGKGGARVVALNRAARDGGLVVGELLSNARSKVNGLQSRDADPAADEAALRSLALWCLRYAPLVSAWDEASGADGLFIESAGAAHLFGGEAAMLADIGNRLRAFGLFPRLAIADTAGAAWALARHGESDGMIVPPGGGKFALRTLPLAALRMSDAARALMRRLGYRRIGELMDQPRAPFAARFDAGVLLHLDRALGCTPEPLLPILPPPVYSAQVQFVEPIFNQEHVLLAATRLLGSIAEDLARDAMGARRVRLMLFRVMSKTGLWHEAEALSIDIGLAAQTRDPTHITRLIALRLDRLGSAVDAQFGFEAAAVHVLVAEPLSEQQSPLAMGETRTSSEGIAQLVDRLQQRLGAGAVRCLDPYQSHIPEHAVRVRPAASGMSDWSAFAVQNVRPLLLLPRPEVAHVLAEIPEGPPRQFRWRGVVHQITGAQGPERIGPQWWRRSGERERDYYLVEDTAGCRFWLYRDGLYGHGKAHPQWFVHGMFA
jgi:protein ImuB